MQIPQTPFYKRSAFIYLCIACVALIVTGVAAMFHNNQPGSRIKNFPDQQVAPDIPPGGNKAILTLQDGRNITLNEVANGKLASQSGVEITKIGHGVLTYRKEADVPVQKGGMNTIVTPNGGTYQLTLPDGSKVWLNAASKLSFPTSFYGMKERQVNLSGEAYFEIALDGTRPFKVIANRGEVQVIEAHFNINSYLDDTWAKATLFKGSAKIDIPATQPVTLVPGQQAVVNQGAIQVVSVDLNDVLAWKNGVFVFKEAPLESIMKEISRWYDIDVSYTNIDRNKLYTATAPCAENISTVLKQLELSGGVHFQIEEGRIVVTGL
jgi:transmembrane sensor